MRPNLGRVRCPSEAAAAGAQAGAASPPGRLVQAAAEPWPRRPWAALPPLLARADRHARRASLHPEGCAAAHQTAGAAGARSRRRGRCRSAADAVTETLESSSLSEWVATATVRRFQTRRRPRAERGADAARPAQGYCVLAGACVRSIPQIIRIQRSQRWARSAACAWPRLAQRPDHCLPPHSAQGLSEVANLSELLAYRCAGVCVPWIKACEQQGLTSATAAAAS